MKLGAMMKFMVIISASSSIFLSGCSPLNQLDENLIAEIMGLDLSYVVDHSRKGESGASVHRSYILYCNYSSAPSRWGGYSEARPLIGKHELLKRIKARHPSYYSKFESQIEIHEHKISSSLIGTKKMMHFRFARSGQSISYLEVESF